MPREPTTGSRPSPNRQSRPWWTLLLLAAGCGRPGAVDPAAGGMCSTRLPDETPPMSDAAPAELPRSHISVGVEVAVARLERELGRQVPTTLARESGRDIGAPGQVSYVVRRGGFDVSLEGDRLLVRTPVSAEVEVCKPLGPFCPTYGRCSPRLLSSASVPLVLDERYELASSRVSVALTKPCVIAGIDASPEIRKIASQQAGAVQRRINASVPPLRPMIEAGYEQLFVPIALGASTCLRVAPERLAQARPALESGVLAAGVSVSGELRVDQPCDLKASGTPTPLPALQIEDKLPTGVSLDVPIRMSFTEVGAELSRSLKSHRTPRLRVAQITTRGARIGDRSRLLLDATLDGSVCGQVVLQADTRWDAAGSRLRLHKVRIVPGQPKRAELLRDAGLEQLVEQHAAIALPVDVSGTPTALEGLVERLTRERPEGVEVDVDVRPAKIERVLVDSAGLIPIASFRGHAIVRVR